MRHVQIHDMVVSRGPGGSGGNADCSTSVGVGVEGLGATLDSYVLPYYSTRHGIGWRIVAGARHSRITLSTSTNPEFVDRYRMAQPRPHRPASSTQLNSQDVKLVAVEMPATVCAASTRAQPYGSIPGLVDCMILLWRMATGAVPRRRWLQRLQQAQQTRMVEAWASSNVYGLPRRCRQKNPP
jgi:hypothetical protein